MRQATIGRKQHITADCNGAQGCHRAHAEGRKNARGSSIAKEVDPEHFSILITEAFRPVNNQAAHRSTNYTAFPRPLVAAGAIRPQTPEKRKDPRVPSLRSLNVGISANGISRSLFCAAQSTLMPANLITFAHFSVSDSMNAPNSRGDIGIGVPPKPTSCTLTLGSARPASIS